MVVIYVLFFSSVALANNDSPLVCEAGDQRCTFVLLSEHNQHYTMVNRQRAKTRLSPFSTFKVANTLIGLELGVIKNTTQILNYDKKNYVPQAWWPAVWKLPSYDLTSAFKYSMVSIYRQLATDIGQVAMQQQLTRFNYGNRDISSQLDNFWLNGSLTISAVEQVQFLQHVHNNTLGLAPASLAALKEVMLVEAGDGYKLYAKTGAGRLDDKSMLGWYVGFVENQQGVYYFALNVQRDSYATIKKLRIAMTTNMLKKHGVL